MALSGSFWLYKLVGKRLCLVYLSFDKSVIDPNLCIPMQDVSFYFIFSTVGGTFRTLSLFRFADLRDCCCFIVYYCKN